jgi:hypothetical protein
MKIYINNEVMLVMSAEKRYRYLVEPLAHRANFRPHS